MAREEKVDGYVVVTDLANHENKLCHVEGWDPRYQFYYIRTNEIGEKVLMTPKTRKFYTTRNRLLMTRKQSDPHCPRCGRSKDDPGNCGLWFHPANDPRTKDA